jgi:hypothetical protein
MLCPPGPAAAIGRLGSQRRSMSHALQHALESERQPQGLCWWITRQASRGDNFNYLSCTNKVSHHQGSASADHNRPHKRLQHLHI